MKLSRLSTITFCVMLGIPVHLNAFQGKNLRLQDAVQMTLDRNTRLANFKYQLQSNQLQQEEAGLKPGFNLDVNTEGQGDSPEYTLSLSSVFEAQQKAKARQASAQAELDIIQNEKATEVIQAIQQTSLSFIKLLALQEQLKMLQQRQFHWQKLQNSMQRQVHAGAASAIDLSLIKSQIHQQSFELMNIQNEIATTQIALATHWNQTEFKSIIAAGNIFEVQESKDLEYLQTLLLQNPLYKAYEIETLATEQQLSLTQSQGLKDYGWSLGTGYATDENTSTLEFGISIPLQTQQRNQYAVQQKQAEYTAVQQTSNFSKNALQLQLTDAYQSHSIQLEQMQLMQTQILPELEKAYQLSQQAYKKGSLNFQNYLATEDALFNAKLKTLNTALALHQIRFSIDVLTGFTIDLQI